MMMRLLVLCATLDVSLGAAYTAGTVYQSNGENDNTCPGTTTAPTKAECDIVAKTIQTTYSSTDAYKDLQKILRGGLNDNAADFGSTGLAESTAGTTNGATLPKDCYIKASGGIIISHRGSMTFNNHATGGGNALLFKVCCVGACPTSAPVVAAATATAAADPHFSSGHGDMFDFKGEDNTVYSLLSASKLAVNALFQHTDFMGAAKRRIHGSYMRAIYLVVPTPEGQMLKIEYSSTHTAHAFVFVNEQKITLAPGSKYEIGGISFILEGHTLTTTTPEWKITATARYTAGLLNATTCADGKCTMDIAIDPLFDTDTAKVAPHGLIGQSYDQDDLRVIGKKDKFGKKGTEVTTDAMGEGAIEGVAADYAMASKFETAFAYSRFGKEAAAPRDVSKLTGVKLPRTDGVKATAA